MNWLLRYSITFLITLLFGMAVGFVLLYLTVPIHPVYFSMGFSVTWVGIDVISDILK